MIDSPFRMHILPLDTLLRNQNIKPRWVGNISTQLKMGVVAHAGGAVLERLRQGDCYKCEASLVYIVGRRIKPCSFCVTQKQTNKQTAKHDKSCI